MALLLLDNLIKAVGAIMNILISIAMFATSFSAYSYDKAPNGEVRFHWINHSSYNDTSVVYQSDRTDSRDDLRLVDIKNRNTYFCLDGSLVFRTDKDKFIFYKQKLRDTQASIPFELIAGIKKFTIEGEYNFIGGAGTKTNILQDLTYTDGISPKITYTFQSHIIDFLARSNESVLTVDSNLTIKNAAGKPDPLSAPVLAEFKTKNRCLNFDLFTALSTRFVAEFNESKNTDKYINFLTYDLKDIKLIQESKALKPSYQTISYGALLPDISGAVVPTDETLEKIDQIALLERPLYFYNLNKKLVQQAYANQINNGLSYIKYINDNGYLFADQNANNKIKTYKLDSSFNKYEDYKKNIITLNDLSGSKCFGPGRPFNMLQDIMTKSNGKVVEKSRGFFDGFR
jgi:hypothetical protein